MEGVPRPTALGQLVVQRGLLSEEQLELAVAEHLASDRPLGQILVEHGYLDEQELTRLLDEQRALSQPPLVTLRTQLESAQAEAARGVELLRERLTAAEEELERETGRRASVEEEPETARTGRAELRPVPDPVDGFVLFVPTAGGYQLLERSGEPPPVGDGVGVSGGELVVVKVGASPLPSDCRPCVFLQER